ncbi:MAG: hypothetical protein ACT4QG_13615 [Sporichthyaceae bacterium]
MRATGEPRSPVRLAAGLAAVQLVFLSVYGIAFHALWRDEAQAWLIARDNSLWGLFEALRYEGHPGLWHLLLFVPAHLGLPVQSMQVITAGIAAACTFVFVRWAPFPTPLKVLFPFGYLVSFEYGLISRNYGLGVLGVLVACALLSAARPRWGAIAAVFVVICQTSVHASTLVPGLALYALWRAHRERSAGDPVDRRRLAMLAGAGPLGLAIAYLQARPQDDTKPLMRVPNGWEQICTQLFNALVPFQKGRPSFWDTQGLPIPLGVEVLGFLVVGLGMVWLLRDTPVLALGHTLGFVALCTIFFQMYQGYPRHYGFLIVNVVAFLWLRQAREAPRKLRQSLRATPVLAAATAVLALQAVGGVRSLALASQYDWSNSQNAADLIESLGYEDRALLLHGDNRTSPILAYLDRTATYTNSSQQSWIRWDTARLRTPTTEEIVEQASALAASSGRQVLVVSDVELTHPRLRDAGSAAGPNTLGDERYWFYSLADSRAAVTPK